ncbi:MAG: NADH-quinone oxidoreductase subunit C [Candidatus Polarisedimenticolia bacterium]
MADGPEQEKPTPPAPPPAAPARPRMDPVEEMLRRPVESAALAALQEAFPDAVLEVVCYAREVTARVPRERVVDLLRFLRDDPRTAFDLLTDLTAVDWPKREQRFDVVYHLYSIRLGHRLRLKLRAGEGEAVPSATPLYRAAEWHEREVFDMFGIPFEGHPDLRRILMPDEWRGHPLRKEYPLEGFADQHMRLR